MIRFTGERIIPDTKHLNYTFQRHLAVYQAIQPLVRDLRVLECGSGEGYGTNFLSQTATEVVGLDVSGSAVHAAQQKYIRANLNFLVADLGRPLPFLGGTFGAIVSLQVIEHLPNPQFFLSEVRRLLAPGGILYVSTPNMKTFSPTGDILDPYHWHEYTSDSLRQLLAQHFTNCRLNYLTGDASVQELLQRDIKLIRRVVSLDVLAARKWLPHSAKRILYDVGLNLFRAKSAETKPLVNSYNFFITTEPIDEMAVLDLVAQCSSSEQIFPQLAVPSKG